MSDAKFVVSGFQIREAIKRWLLQRDTAASAFAGSFFSFEGEEKSGPKEVMGEFEQADYNVARLEEIQQRFNQTVLCNVQGKQVTLALCVKLVGGAGRREKMWRESAVGSKKERYYRDDTVIRERETNKEYAKRALSVPECLKLSQESAKYASAIRNAIARGNSTEVNCAELKITQEEYKQLFE